MKQNNIISLYINKNRDQSGIENLTKFIGFNQQVYLDPALTGYGFIFVTKPSLFIQPIKPAQNNSSEYLAYENMCKDPNFTYFINGENTNEKDLLIVKQLSCFNFSDVTSLFLPIFTNMATSFTPTDTSLDTTNAFRTREGYNIPIPMNTTNSEAAGSLSIGVTETNNLDFYKLLNIWVEYINNVTNGTFTANPDMIKNNMLDYMCSIYYFMIDADGRTLKYWCKYTGCFPTNKPSSSFSYQKGSKDNINYDIPFQYTFKEEMNPQILEDFNMVSLRLVTATFSDESYNNLLTNIESYTSLGYNSFMNGSLLNKNKLFNESLASSIMKDNSRDPIIFFEPSSSDNVLNDQTTAKYVLSFGRDTLNNKLLNSLVEDQSAFSYSIFDDNK